MGLVEAGRRRERVAFRVQALLRGKVVAMLALADRPGDRKGHDRVRHLVEAIGDAAQSEPPKRRTEAIGEVLVPHQSEGERRVRPVEQLDAARGGHGVDLVEAQLSLEKVERPVCLFAGRAAEMRGTVDEQARLVQRLADTTVAIEVGLGIGHGANTTR